MPQLQHNMAVCGAERAMLSVIFGNHKYEMFEVASDWLYQHELLEAEQQFWDCVASGEEPVVRSRRLRRGRSAPARSASRATTPGPQLRSTGSSIAHAAKIHGAATSLIKTLVEEDVCRAFGHGIEAKRSKSGAITIRELVA